MNLTILLERTINVNKKKHRRTLKINEIFFHYSRDVLLIVKVYELIDYKL